MNLSNIDGILSRILEKSEYKTLLDTNHTKQKQEIKTNGVFTPKDVIEKRSAVFDSRNISIKFNQRSFRNSVLKMIRQTEVKNETYKENVIKPEYIEGNTETKENETIAELKNILIGKTDESLDHQEQKLTEQENFDNENTLASIMRFTRKNNNNNIKDIVTELEHKEETTIFCIDDINGLTLENFIDSDTIQSIKNAEKINEDTRLNERNNQQNIKQVTKLDTDISTMIGMVNTEEKSYKQEINKSTQQTEIGITEKEANLEAKHINNEAVTGITQEGNINAISNTSIEQGKNDITSMTQTRSQSISLEVGSKFTDHKTFDCNKAKYEGKLVVKKDKLNLLGIIEKANNGTYKADQFQNSIGIPFAVCSVSSYRYKWSLGFGMISHETKNNCPSKFLKMHLTPFCKILQQDVNTGEKITVVFKKSEEILFESIQSQIEANNIAVCKTCTDILCHRLKIYDHKKITLDNALSSFISLTESKQ